MGKFVKYIKIAQNLLKSSLTAMFVFFKTTGNLILISITKKKFENRTINTKDMEKNVKNIKIAKNLQKGSLAVIVGSPNDGKFNFDIYN